jgi:hypothetical protein
MISAFGTHQPHARPARQGSSVRPSTSLPAKRTAAAMISRNTKWHGRPISWGHAAAEEETRRAQIGGIKDGFAGFVPRASAHYGSSHYGGLPFRDSEKWQAKGPLDCTRRRNQPQPRVNRQSSSEIGRQAWNVEWSNHGKLLVLLTPAQLKKYDLSKQRDYGSGMGARDLEGGVNSLERLTGLDLDGDGDVGVAGRASGGGTRPVSARAITPPRTPTGARRPHSGGARGDGQAHGGPPSARTIFARDGSASERQRRQHTDQWVPVSRNHRTPAHELWRNKNGGVKPRYQGHVPNVQTQIGVTTVGGMFPDPSLQA